MAHLSLIIARPGLQAGTSHWVTRIIIQVDRIFHRSMPLREGCLAARKRKGNNDMTVTVVPIIMPA